MRSRRFQIFMALLVLGVFGGVGAACGSDDSSGGGPGAGDGSADGTVDGKSDGNDLTDATAATDATAEDGRSDANDGATDGSDDGAIGDSGDAASCGAVVVGRGQETPTGSCRFSLPMLSYQQFANLEVEYAPGSGTSYLLAKDGVNGWTYDNPTTPTLVLLNGTSCSNFRADPNAQIRYLLPCTGDGGIGPPIH